MSESSNDPWVVQEAKGKFEPLPAAAYFGPFVGVEEVALADGSLKWRFVYRVKAGAMTGKTTNALTDRDIKPTSLPGRLIAGMLGREIQPGENVRQLVESCRDKDFMFVVQPGPKGGKPMVRSVSKPPAM